MDATATFQVGDSTYEVVSTEDMDWEEAKLVKQLSGMALGAFERGLVDGDPDAWFAEVFVALRRVDPKITPQKVEEKLKGQKLVAIYKSLKQNEEEADAIPPASTPPNSGDMNGDEPKSEELEPSPLTETLETSGSQP